MSLNCGGLKCLSVGEDWRYLAFSYLLRKEGKYWGMTRAGWKQHIFFPFASHRSHTMHLLRSASQIVVAILVSVVTSALYINWRPFERESDDNLAITTQISLVSVFVHAAR